MSTSQVQLTVKNTVGYIEFYNPAHNALPASMLTKLSQLIVKAGSDPSIAVLVIQSGGDRTFCAGASFEELKAISTPDEGAEFFEGFANVINALRCCPKLTIARVQGKAVGGGLGIAAAADYCMATTYSEIKLSELAIGIGPFVIEPALIRKMGLSALSQLSLQPTQFFSAQWAQEKGLFMNVFPSIEILDKQVASLSQRLSSYNPEALKILKETLWEGTAHWSELLKKRAAISGQLVLSAFTKSQLKKY
tara:strand:+ start:15156 stop:15905 length:750 start_codon:yes stop_codon:yes gene_type:complete